MENESFVTNSELWRRAQAEPEPDWRDLYGHVGLRGTAADTAAECARLHKAGEPLAELWRFGVLQALDSYLSARRRGGPVLARGVFAQEPPATGAAEIDAAYAALAEHLAEQDGWEPATWVNDPRRRVEHWYANTPVIFRAQADEQSPKAFRTRGIFITPEALWRA
ncbi:hypothetical protein GCM10022377_22000 [Zhihengliuella alba]|uniref:Uncharacterized protein n=1 Tax=Zhihengliuella alba TaxID=547018 RepID=A0ABP7DQN2_9MICC